MNKIIFTKNEYVRFADLTGYIVKQSVNMSVYWKVRCVELLITEKYLKQIHLDRSIFLNV